MQIDLSNFIKEWFLSVGIPVHYVELSENDFSWFDLGLRKQILGEPEAVREAFDWFLAAKKRTVYHIEDSFQCHYTTWRLPDENQWVIIGPFLIEEIKGDRFQHLFKKLRLPKSLEDVLQNYYYGIHVIYDQSNYEQLIVQFVNQYFGKNEYEIEYVEAGLGEERIMHYKNIFRATDDPFINEKHIEERYRDENILMQAIYSGNEGQAIAYMSRINLSMLPKRLPDGLRDQKDYTIALNTILRKAVEQAGVHPVHIDGCSNMNVQLIEQITNSEECWKVRLKIIRRYCNLIREHRLSDYSLPVRKVLTIISIDLAADLSLKNLAEHLHINASYLSTLFKKETGVSLTEYVTNSRIDYAKRLLANTDLPMKVITQQCGFSDINYFIRQFKKCTGMTPKYYKESTVRAKNSPYTTDD